MTVARVRPRTHRRHSLRKGCRRLLDRLAGLSVAVVNSGSYGGGMLLAPGARLDDGALHVLLRRP
ncbi:MAG: YegS C-terminal kinase beta sandwich-like domain [Solirubrobacteraceae bacterium]|nr:YegS C-terminal kinase beta sandwich-like domain [Solirubrobacteraceae bacterium]